MSRFIDQKAAEVFECPICLDLIDEAVQTDACSHIFCRECIEEYAATKRRFPCPKCRGMWSKKAITRCRFVDQQIQSLKVRCPNSSITAEKEAYLKRTSNNNSDGDTNTNIPSLPQSSNVSRCRRSKRIREKKRKHRNQGPELETESSSNDDKKVQGRKRRQRDQPSHSEPPSKRRKMDAVTEIDAASNGVLCEWTGEIRDEKDHLKNCPFAMILCPHCKLFVMRQDMDQHHQECSCIPVQCGKCKQHRIPRALLHDHVQEDCPMTSVPCCRCRANVLRKDLQDHLDEECPDMIVPCSLGCDQSVKRKDMDQHIASNAAVHLVIVRREMENLVAANKTLDLRAKSLERANQAKDRQIGTLTQQIQRLTQQPIEPQESSRPNPHKFPPGAEIGPFGSITVRSGPRRLFLTRDPGMKTVSWTKRMPNTPQGWVQDMFPGAKYLPKMNNELRLQMEELAGYEFSDFIDLYFRIAFFLFVDHIVI